ncbi:hypothetical protein BA891_07520 [Vibrio natriegens]|nr:hypothetical protein BA891_07520 [Vibrio natriegens]
MLAILLIVVLVSGYIYSSKHLPSRYKMAKSDGWDLYFQVARRGTEIAIISAVICCAIDFSNSIGPTLKNLFGMRYNLHLKQLPFSHDDFKLVVWGIFTIFLSYFAAYVKSRKYKVDPVQDLNLLRHVVRDNPLEFFIIDATLTFVDDDQDSRTVCITLSSGKVYIGFCVGGNNVTQGNLEHIEIIPIRSGYREKDTQDLEITNNYEGYFLEQGANIAEFLILIPTSQINSYQYFDLPAYEAIQAAPAGTCFSDNTYPPADVNSEITSEA